MNLLIGNVLVIGENNATKEPIEHSLKFYYYDKSKCQENVSKLLSILVTDLLSMGSSLVSVIIDYDYGNV